MSNKYDLIEMFNWIRKQVAPFSPYEFEKEFGMSRNASKPWFRNNQVFNEHPYPNNAMRYTLGVGRTLNDFVQSLEDRKSRSIPSVNKVVTNKLGTFDLTTPPLPGNITEAMTFVANNGVILKNLLNSAEWIATTPVADITNEGAENIIKALGGSYAVIAVLKQLAVLYVNDPRLNESAPGVAKVVLSANRSN